MILFIQMVDILLKREVERGEMMLVVKVGSVVDDFIYPDGRYTEREVGRGGVMLVVMVGSVVDDFIYPDGRYTEREVGRGGVMLFVKAGSAIDVDAFINQMVGILKEGGG